MDFSRFTMQAPSSCKYATLQAFSTTFSFFSFNTGARIDAILKQFKYLAQGHSILTGSQMCNF